MRKLGASRVKLSTSGATYDVQFGAEEEHEAQEPEDMDRPPLPRFEDMDPEMQEQLLFASSTK